MSSTYEKLDAAFEFNVQRGKEDDLEVIARATKKFLEKKTGKMKLTHSETVQMLAWIIEDGFLEDVKALREDFIEINKQRIAEAKKQENEAKRRVEQLTRTAIMLRAQISQLESKREEIEAQIRELDGKTIEDDLALIGAKKAYEFAFQKLHDPDKAIKSYNSYLLMGHKAPAPETVDAEAEIQAAKAVTSWRRV